MNSQAVRAVVFDAAAADMSKTRIGSVPTPSPAAGELLVDVAYAGVNFKDIMARRGDPGYVTEWPFTPGLEAAGTVRALGEGVTGFDVGDRVLALTDTGGLAECAIAESALTVHVPDQVDLAAATAVPGVFATAQLLLHRVGRVRAGDAIVVHSASGAVGAAVLSLARQAGLETILGIVGAPARLAAAREIGYTDAFVRTDAIAEQIRAALPGPGAQLVLDPQGTRWLNDDLDMLAPGGRVVLFGNAGGEPLAPLPHPGELYRRNASIAGFSLESLAHNAPGIVRDAMTDVLGQMLAGVIRPSYTLVHGLESVPETQQKLADGTGRGKYIVQVS